MAAELIVDIAQCRYVKPIPMCFIGWNATELDEIRFVGVKESLKVAKTRRNETTSWRMQQETEQ